ncbi:MAG TPA: hypothetical protein VLH12_06695, partial [Usitatibacter sp.]|nr:hypothetical protein [Usitatibacter sp.]
VACLLHGAALAAEPPSTPPQPLPSFAQLEARGVRIGTITVDSQNIFDLDDPKENNSLFRLANTLHVRTRPEVIRRLILFKTGDPVTVQAIDETERVMRSNHFLYDVVISPVSIHDGIVDIGIATRDTWTLDLTGRYARSGGTNTTAFGIVDDNFLGTGTKLGLAQTSDVDRHGTEFIASYGQAFDGWTAMSYAQARYSDGDRSSASVTRPFYSLDTRWAAGASWDRWNRIESIYNAGDTTGKYRQRSEIGEIFGGWSPGLVRGWAQRISAGATLQDHSYEPQPGETAPSPLPLDHSTRGFFLRHEVVEDKFVKLRNRDQIARPEFFEMGFASRLQVTRSLEFLGASRSAWLYDVSISKGFTLDWGDELLASAALQRQIASTGNPLERVGGMIRYFSSQTPRYALYAALSGDRLGDGAAAPDQLLLGGDNGLRGYPLRYQSGDQRALFTIEQRAYTDWYIFRLVRVGGAVFYDRGRAWGGVNQNTVNGGWLSDVGAGLRLAFDRAAFGNVLHADIAVPLQRAPGIKSVQFIVKTQVSF